MGSEELIARRILADAFQSYTRGPLNPVREAELRDLIAAAIREAVAAEREEAARLAEAVKYGADSARKFGHQEYAQGMEETGQLIAAAIRARSAP